MAGALAGVRVLELGGGVAAPFAAKLLADYGADVLKVEPPEGDPARRHGPFLNDIPHPETSALFLYLNTGKRSRVLDLATPAGRAAFLALVTSADIVIEDLPAGTPAALGLGWEALHAVNPALTLVSLTAFGQTGPYSRYAATNLTAFAMGGQMAITGDPGREPLKNAGYQADYQLGLNGFAAAAIGVFGARHSGWGRQIDIAGVECMASVLEASLNTFAYTGRSLGTRRGNIRSSTIAVYECEDGHLGVHAMPRNLPFLLELMGLPDLMRDERFSTPAARLAHNDELIAIYMGWALGQRKKATYARAGQMRAPVAYVHTLDDLRASPQLAAREYWRTCDHPAAGTQTYPGPPFQMSDTPWRLAPAPLLGDAGEEGFPARETPVLAMPAATGAVPPLPLSGVRVLDLTMVWAGPYGTRLLADMGAEVLKVEAVNFYDQIRNLGFAAPDTEQRWNKAAYFNHNSRNKYGVTLDLAGEAGRDLLLELTKIADVVIENYRAEVMDRLGLGYEALRAVNPAIILVSMPGHGKSGPERDYVAYGTNIEQLSGLVSLSGYVDGGPQASGISYGDPMSGTAMAGAVAAALLHRDRTGRGQYVELAQRELLTSLIGEYVVAHSMNGSQPPPLGNRHPFHAPHGVYPVQTQPYGSRGDAAAYVPPPPEPNPNPPAEEPWIAIACETDAQFAALCRVIGRPELAADLRYATEPQRYARQEELDGVIAAWTAAQDKMAAFHTLQAAGVPCGPVLTAAELMIEPHLRARGFFERVTHPDAGTWDMEGPIYRLSPGPAHIRINAPRFGEHTAWALGHLLGLPSATLESLEAAGITGDTPNMSVHQ